MKRGEIRDTQIANLIYEELGYVLSSANDRRLSELTVTRVLPGGGGSHYIVHVRPCEGSTLASAGEIKEALKAAAGFLRAELATAINLKRTPELTIMPDPLWSFLPNGKA